jgi:hypothetical protein
MFLAHLSTRHFDFDALSTTRDGARDIMLKGMRQHAFDRDIDAKQFIDDFEDGINVFEIEPGQCVLDYSWVVYGQHART